MKVISYSVFGQNDKYTIGMLKNVELCKLYYPDWTCFIYYNNTVPEDIIQKLKENTNVRLIDMSHMNIPGMFWRFLPNDNIEVEYFIVRDSDSRITERESIAVNEWIAGGQTLHIMRDHPHHHYSILGGMWGMKCDRGFNMYESIMNYNKSSDLFIKMIDMNFLRDVIYAKYKSDTFIHASFHKWENSCKDFPTKLEDYKFVGEIYNADESREYQYKLLK